MVSRIIGNLKSTWTVNVGFGRLEDARGRHPATDLLARMHIFDPRGLVIRANTVIEESKGWGRFLPQARRPIRSRKDAATEEGGVVSDYGGGIQQAAKICSGSGR